MMEYWSGFFPKRPPSAENNAQQDPTTIAPPPLKIDFLPKNVALLLAAAGLLACAVAASYAETPPWDVSADPARVLHHLEHAPDWNEKPFFPADGETISVNPPAFVWLPVKPYDGGYLLKISRKPDFPENNACAVDQTITVNAPINIHIPTEPLPTGRWHWRAGVRISDKQIVWGKTRSFDVPETAAVWPFPRMDELLAKIPHDRPRLFFPGNNLDRVRSQCRGVLHRQYAKLLTEAEACLGKELVPEPDHLMQKGAARGAEYKAIIKKTRPSMDGMETCALAYLLSGRPEFGAEARRRILHFFAWNPNGSTSLFHNDEPAMWIMQRGVRAYDWTYALFSPEERAKIESVMKIRCGQFRERLRRMPFESRPYTSHVARDLGFLGEAAICFAHEWPESPDWLSYVLAVYRGVYPAWGADDGGWQEGPSYWQAYMGFALHFAAALEKATGETIIRRPFFRNTPYYKLYTNPPYAAMSPFGDAQEKPPGRGAGRLMYCFSTLLADPYARWYADAARSGPGTMAMSFALADDALEARPPVDLPRARVFPGVGLAAMHDNPADTRGNAYLVMRSSPLGSVSHGHADQNAFAIEAYGEALAIASGYYPWYGSPHHHEWTRSTKAKNCITFDGGQGQIQRSAKSRGRIARFVALDGFDYALGDAAEAYGGRLSRALRHVIHIRPGTFVIIDELAAPEPLSFEWNLHALDKMTIDAGRQLVSIKRNRAALSADFVRPRGLSFSQTDRFIPPPENGLPNQWRLTAAAPKSKSTVFFVVMQTHPAAQSPPSLRLLSREGCEGVAWVDGGVEHTVLYGPRGIKTAQIETDARIAAFVSRGATAGLSSSAGNISHKNTAGQASSGTLFQQAVRDDQGQYPTNWLVVDATRLDFNGRRLFSAEPSSAAKKADCRVTAACSCDEDGASFACDSPEAVIRIRLAVDKVPKEIRLDGEKWPFECDDGAIELNLPSGRHATDVYYSPPPQEPRLVVKIAKRETIIAGRMFNRSDAVWQYRFDGRDGQYRLTRPAGLGIINGVDPVECDKIQLRQGRVLWLYGKAKSAELGPLRFDRL